MIDFENMSFTDNHMAIQNPTVSECGRWSVSPDTYGFEVEGTGGGCTAWVKKFDNGIVVLTNGHLSHNLGKVGDGFVMCFYDGKEDGDTDVWGNRICCTDLFVGVLPTDLKTPDGWVVDYKTTVQIINQVYNKTDIFIDTDQALALVDIFHKIDLANT
jgi:hypothetical protein